MAKKKTYEELRRDAYVEFKEWAIREVINSIITKGFREIGGTLDMILHQYRAWEEKYPYKPKD